MSESELHPCKCGCGELVTGTWARGHHRRGADSRIPDPEAPDEAFTDPIEPGDPGDPGDPDEQDDPDGDEGQGDEHAERAAAGRDPAPAHADRGWPKSKAPAKRKPRPGRVSAAVRADVAAKLDFMVEMPARFWEARDPYCGGLAVHSAPEISGALADLVVQSPDLLEFFTGGTASGFMAYLALIKALAPLGQGIAAHHVFHTVEILPPDGSDPADLGQYAA